VEPLVDLGPELTAEQLARYSRHLLLPQVGLDGQRRLGNASVCVLGAGGLGCPAMVYLAAAGIGRITIIDSDVVEESNLQRQVLHRVEDLGRPKVESAARALRELNPLVEVVPRQVRLTPENARTELAGHDIVLDGTDNFDTRYVVDDACTALGLPRVWAAVLRFNAQVASFVPAPLVRREQAVRLRDLFPRPPHPDDVPSCAEAGVLGMLCGQVGSVMAGEVIKLVAGFGEPLVGRVLLMDALTAQTRIVPLRPAPASAHEPTAPGAAQAAAEQPRRPVLDLRQVEPTEVRHGWAGTVLDVREPAEHALGMVPGAKPVPVGEVLSWTSPEELPEGPVLVYCKAGPRAERAAAHLVRLGHRDVAVLRGGILAWIDQVDPSLPRY
jgi:sulfur-carrier protein adenylyltransferase/sulfurtransferase